MMVPGRQRRNGSALRLIQAAALACAVANSAAAQTPPSSAPQTPFNLHVVVAESLLNRFVTRSEEQPGEIDDFILGAKVDGRKWTTTQLSLDLRPSADRVHAVFVLDGHVQSQTTGRTEQGAIHTLGEQQFHALKDVFFDGLQLSTRHAGVFVRAHNRPVGASTPLDGTLLEGLGNRIALKQAERRRQQSEEYARGRVAEQVNPSFDREVDQRLADANDRLEDQVRAALRRANLLPTSQLARSSDTHLHYAARVAGEGQSLIAPSVPLVGPHGLTIYLHESLFNGWLDRLNLQGRKVTDRELRALGDSLQSGFGNNADRDTEAPAAPSLPLETEIEFDATAPLVVRFVDGRMELELRATFRPAGQALLPPLSITVPVKLELQPTYEWHAIYGEIGIQSRNGDEVSVVAQTLVRQAIQADLPPISFPQVLKISRWPADRPFLKMASFQAADGWLVVSLDTADQPAPAAVTRPISVPSLSQPQRPTPDIDTPIRARPR